MTNNYMKNTELNTVPCNNDGKFLQNEKIVSTAVKSSSNPVVVNEKKPTLARLTADTESQHKAFMKRREWAVSSSGFSLFKMETVTPEYVESGANVPVSNDNLYAVVIDENFSKDSPVIDVALVKSQQKKLWNIGMPLFWASVPINLLTFMNGNWAGAGTSLSFLWPIIFSIAVVGMIVFPLTTHMENKKEIAEKAESSPGYGLFPVEDEFLVAELAPITIEILQKLFKKCDNDPLITDIVKRKFQNRQTMSEITSWIHCAYLIYTYDEDFPSHAVPAFFEDAKDVVDALAENERVHAQKEIENEAEEKQLTQFREEFLGGFMENDSATSKEAALEYVRRMRE